MRVHGVPDRLPRAEIGEASAHLLGKTAWTKRDKESGEFMDVKKSKKKFKGVRREK